MLWWLWVQERESEEGRLVILDEERWQYCSTVTELGRSLGVKQGNVSRMTSELVKRGLVRLMPEPGSKVRKRVGLTKKGRKMMEKIVWKIDV